MTLLLFSRMFLFLKPSLSWEKCNRVEDFDDYAIENLTASVFKKESLSLQIFI